ARQPAGGPGARFPRRPGRGHPARERRPPHDHRRCMATPLTGASKYDLSGRELIRMVPGVPPLEVPAPTLDPAELAAVAGRLASFANRWSALAAPHPDRRWYARLHRDTDHEVWLLGWDRAQGIDLHDHGGSAGAFCVVTGRLVESYTDRTSQRLVRHRHVGPGEVLAFGPDHVHDLA